MKKECGYKRSDVWMYVQNRMSREEETEFQQHLMHCDDCREELAQLRLMVRSLGKKERRFPAFRVWMIAASVACIVMGGGAYWHYFVQGEGGAVPGGSNSLKINPPGRHDDHDSIAPRDTIKVDTIQGVEIEIEVE